MSEEKGRDAMRSVIRTARLHRRVMDGKMQRLGIHHSQHSLLMFLFRQNGQISQREIADAFDISPAAVAGSIKKLKQGGYVAKTVSLGDGRYSEISLTEKGRAIAEQSRAIFREVDREVFQGVSSQEEEQLCGILHRIAENLKQLEQAQRKDEIK